MIPSQSSTADYLQEYPPADLEPDKRVKVDKSKPPPLDGGGNLGGEKDWEIPDRFRENGSYGIHRTFEHIVEPSYADLGTFLFVIFVNSSPDEQDVRKAIRKTYGFG